MLDARDDTSMKSVRFSKVVEKSGKPEVYLLMSETDPDFNKALKAGKIMSLSDESHGSGTEYGTVGYDKKRHGQLLIFPKSLKAFSEAKIIGIKYDLFAEEDGHHVEKSSSSPKKSSKTKKEKSVKPKPAMKPKEEKAARQKKAPKPAAKKVIPFPTKKAQHEDDDEDDLKATVRQAMRALEKGNSVAAYNILKRIIPDF
jgi:hypothetical protein